MSTSGPRGTRAEVVELECEDEEVIALQGLDDVVDSRPQKTRKTREKKVAAHKAQVSEAKAKKAVSGAKRGSKRSRSAAGVALETLDRAQEAEKTLVSDPFSLRLQACKYGDHSGAGNCKRNPKCVFGLGERGSGIWGSKPAVLAASQARPKIETRDCSINGTPAGLENLGATCYVNALLQTLFFNPSVRQLVYEWTPAVETKHDTSQPSEDRTNENKGDALTDEPMREIQNVFAHLQGSLRKTYDLSCLAVQLGLSTGIQQDAQEFNKLLLSYIDRIASKQHNARLKQLSQLFLGKQEYVTVCQSCNTESRRAASFQELDLQIKGQSSIEDCFVAYAGKESLDGHNQFFCSTCDKKCDAMRCSQLDSLPDVLNIQLMRFVYDAKTYSKRKVKDAIKLPLEVDFASDALRPMLSPRLVEEIETLKRKKESLDGFKFMLTAVLHHKGQSANSGHYTADVLDRSRGKVWWSFDDMKVTPIEIAVNLKASRNAYMLVYEKVKFTNVPGLAETGFPALPQRLEALVNSSNASVRDQIEKATERRKVIQSAIEQRKEDYAEIFRKQSIGPCCFREQKAQDEPGYWVPTVWLRQWITGEEIPSKQGESTASNSSPRGLIFIDVNEGEEKAEAQKVKEEKSQTGPAMSDSDLLYKRAPDMLAILCPHSDPKAKKYCLDPANLPNFKLVNRNTWELLLEKCCLDPNEVITIRDDRFNSVRCAKCIDNLSSNFKASQKNGKVREEIEAILQTPMISLSSIEEAERDQYAFISRSWIAKWKRYTQKANSELSAVIEELHKGRTKKKRPQTNYASDISKAGPTSNSLLNMLDKNSGLPTANINEELCCEHGNFRLGLQGKRLIPRQSWEFIRNNALEGRCKDTSKDFAGNAEPCPICLSNQNQSNESKRAYDDEKYTQLKHKEYGALLRNLLKRRCGHPNLSAGMLPRGEYRCVPRAWMSRWREYIGEGNKNVRPGSLIEAVETRLQCKAHSEESQPKMVLHPRAVMWLRREDSHLASALLPIEQVKNNDLNSDAVEIISVREFEALLKHYPKQPSEKDQDCGSSKLPSVHLESDIDLQTAAPLSSDSLPRFEPDLCTKCFESQKSNFIKTRQVFQDQPIFVQVLDAGEVAGELSANKLTMGQRRSTRKRSSSRSKTQLFVDSKMALLTVVFMLLERDKLPSTAQPRDVQVFLANGSQIEDTSLTLEQCGVAVEDTLSIKVEERANSANDGEPASLSEWVSAVDSFSSDIVSNENTATEHGFSGSVLAPPKLNGELQPISLDD